jgi:hypothetical protein
MTIEEWEIIESRIQFIYAKDNYFEQQKTAVILRDRLATLQLADPYVGRYYSQEWVRKNILFQSEEDIEEIDTQIVNELDQPLNQPMYDQDGNPLKPGGEPLAAQTPIGPQGGVSSVSPGQQFN